MVHQRNAVVAGVVPCLRSKTRVALPDLHLDTIARSSTSVEAVVGTCDLDGSLTAVEDPLLGVGTIAVIADCMSVVIYMYS